MLLRAGTMYTRHTLLFLLPVLSMAHSMVTDVMVERSYHAARRLSTNVASGQNTLSNALAAASAGDTLVLADGTYTLTSTLTIDKDITIRASNQGQAILDGENSKRVILVSTGTVVLDGLSITNGQEVRDALSSSAPLKFQIWKLTTRSLVWQAGVRCWL